MKRNALFIFNHKPVIILVSIGVALGTLLAGSAWLFPAAVAKVLASEYWPLIISMVGALLMFLALKLASTKGYLDVPKPVLFLAVAAATALIYLFPELFAPGCNGMPKAFAACPASCQITTCSHWIAAGDPLPNGGTCSPSHPWDVGCCISYTTTCDANCDTGGDGESDDPPTVTGNVVCSLTGNGGWCRSRAKLNLSASDPQGYATTISGDIDGTAFSCAAGSTCSKVLPEGSGSIHFKATAATSGLSSSTGTTSFAFDPTPPTATLAITGALGAAGWYTSAHAATTGTDATSGISVTQVAVDGGAWQASATLAEGTHSVTGRAIDNAGNVTVTPAQVVNVDATPPIVSANVTSGTLVAGWYVSNATVTASASDATSGLALLENRVDSGAWSDGNTVTLTTDGIHAIDFRATDQAGLQSSTSLSVKVDESVPAITFTPTGTMGSNGWYTSSVSLSISAQDEYSGVASIEYNLDGTDWVPGSSLTLNDGDHTVEARATDKAGNQATASTTIRVDTRSPSAVLINSAKIGHMNWYVSDAIISADPSDATSGVSLVEYRVDDGDWKIGMTTPAVSGDGAHTVGFRVTDVAGNQSVITSYFWIDATPPLSAFVEPADGSINTLYGEVKLSGLSSDATSGLGGVQISLDKGKSWQSLSLIGDRWSYDWDTRHVPDGSYTVLARTNDVAGNINPAARTTVIVANDPPKVKVQDWWWSWQAGQIKVKAAIVPIQETTITIACAPYHKDVVLHFKNGNEVPVELQWDRHCGEGAYAADPGDYPVTVRACDTFGRCTSAAGAIKVLPIPLPQSTWTPSPVPTASPTSEKTRTVQRSQPTPTQIVALPVTTSESPAPALPPEVLPVWFVSGLVLAGFLAALASSSLADARPRALKQLGKTMAKVRDG